MNRREFIKRIGQAALVLPFVDISKTEASSGLPDAGSQPAQSGYITGEMVANSRVWNNINEGISARIINDNFRARENSNGQFEFEHRPIGLDTWYSVDSGCTWISCHE